MMADVTDDFVAGLRQFVDTYPDREYEIDRVLTRNAVWVGRTQGVGVMTAQEAINYSLSGPMLRASGVRSEERRVGKECRSRWAPFDSQTYTLHSLAARASDRS